MISFDIQNIIVEYIYNIIDKVNLYHLTKEHECNILIENLYKHPVSIIRMDQKTILQDKYRNITELNLKYNLKIYDVSHLVKLKKLKCSRSINQDGINKLKNIEELCIYDNTDIYDLNHLTKLKKLEFSSFVRTFNRQVSYPSRLKQEGIIKLKNLEVLNIHNNSFITDINHMSKLRELDCSGNYCKLGQDGINRLTNIEVLKVDYNKNIYDINHLTKLRKLSCRSYCGIEQNGFNKLKNIEVLIVENNSKIVDVNHLKKLRYLDCSNSSRISYLGINQLKDLTTIYNKYNNNFNNGNNNYYVEEYDREYVNLYHHFN